MITLNCFTNGFNGCPSTIDGKTPRQVRWVYGQRDFDGVTIFEDGAIWDGSVRSVKSRVKVGWLHEPRALHPENYRQAEQWRDHFACILTHDQQLLDAYPGKFRHCIHGGVSIEPKYWGAHHKKRLVGMFDTKKNSTDGHRLRHQIASEVKGIDVFYNLYGEAKVGTMMQYRFWVVVENSAEPNWFTEHVLDPLAIGCVPLYYFPRAAVGQHSIDQYAPMSALVPFDSIAALQALVDRCHNAPDDVPAIPLREVEWLKELEFVEDWMVKHPLREYVR